MSSRGRSTTLTENPAWPDLRPKVVAVVEEKKRRKRVKPTTSTGRVTTPASRRYTPPTQQSSFERTPMWVPVIMFALFTAGVAMIVLNYLPGAPVLPGDTSNAYLLGGLGLILLGFIAATRYH